MANLPKYLSVLLWLHLSLVSFGQTNTFPTTGNVGIGTLSPAAPLEIVQEENPTSDKGLVISEPNNTQKIRMHLADNTNGEYGFLSLGGTTYLRGNGQPSSFNGNLGIGISNPTQEIDVNGEVQSKGFILVDPSLGSNTDYTALYREDLGPDNATVKLRVGDDILGSFQIGYRYWSTGEWISRFYVNNNGRVGIGTTAPDAKLAVKGDIHAQEVKVDLNGAVAPDYVFKEDYDLRSLQEVQDYIQKHGHLPNIPSAQELEANGIDLGQMNLKLLEKIEELTLYIIAQNKKVRDLENQNEQLQSLKTEIELIKQKLKN